MADLVVSLDHLALLREKRRGTEPDPVAAAVLAEMAGVGGISVHLRSDRRHVQERDVRLLREVVKTRLYLGLAATTDAAKLAFALKPEVVILAPERQDEVASSVGLDVLLNQAQIKKLVRALKEGGLTVACFVDPDADQVKATQAVEAEAILLNTRAYADTGRRKESRDELDRLSVAARVASKLGLTVMVGRGLDYVNVREVARLRELQSVHVGHAVTARALFAGLDGALREMRALLREAPPPAV